MTDLNIYQRINKVMQTVKYVQKDGQITGGGANYKAVTHDQVISVARAELVAQGVVIYPNQTKGEFITKRDLTVTPPVKMGLYTGTYEINFVGIDKGDKITVTVEAHANDNGDKAPGKALTYATKSAILKVLCLETGESDESREEMADNDLITNEQAKELFGLLCTPEGNYTQLGSRIAMAFKFNNINEIPAKKFTKILAKAKA